MKRIRIVILPGYGCHDNLQRITAWVRRKQYREISSTTVFPIPIYKPE